MKLKLYEDINTSLVNHDWYSSFKDANKLINYLFPENLNIKVVDNIDEADAEIFAIEFRNIPHKYNSNKINIILCIENCYFHDIYDHYKKYGNYGNKNIQIYLYNHISKLELTDNYIAIPLIYSEINYFNRFYKTIEPSPSGGKYIPFEDKKFCLFVSNNYHNGKYKNKIKEFLKKIGDCDLLDMYKPELGNASCYHSIEFLNVLNKYKFIFVCENSVTDGYITEKIFNCYFARCIPIYFGAKNIEYYFNSNTFINMNDIDNNEDKIKENIELLMNNKDKFNEIINLEKINKNYDDENYKIKLEIFINKLLEKQKTIEKFENNESYSSLLIILFIFLIIGFFIMKKYLINKCINIIK
jgi:hypothetical protein